ncbi:hypothetical protein E1264_27675 [Actinomadura sp. KC216]|uniref:hypothetical protein n=1 Tax=Actinomadura sp. KC216 TaxID=2530370 RepID=UPI00104876B4|nr:hypothetical protein [Actinomadura sp. KC216]TDB83627.1 hypothetical protein E1264_27675 [Actinomadura sp. KC216]
MTAFIGFFGAVLGALVGGVATYLTTRYNLRLTLEHSYDQTLQSKRLERYQALFHISKCLPRYWSPMDETPSRQDLQQYIRSFHEWYFGEHGGGMFLTPAAKDLYIRLLNLLAETAFVGENGPDSAADHPLSETESRALRELASELRRQLAEDVGAANPPRLRWTRPGPQAPPPAIGS